LPAGMASLGRKESNPQPSALETGALPLSYVPVKQETARQEILGAVPSRPRFRFYLGTSRPIAPSMRFEHRALRPSCSKLGDQVYTLSSS
jgi:hypothetical protein